MALSIDELHAKIEEGIQLYAELEQTGIPSSVKAAVAENWELYVDKVQMEALLHYPESERHVDSQRIIPLEMVLRTVREMEEDLIAKTVLDPLDLYFAAVAGKYRFAKYLLQGFSDWRLLWEGLKLLWQILSIGERGFVQIVLNFFEIAAVATIAKLAAKVFKNRDSWVSKMRARALPIPKSVRRVRRRKVSR